VIIDSLMWWNLILAMGMGTLGGEGARFVGAENCKLCHRATYMAWVATPHAAATRVLAPEEHLPTCLRCHATGSGALTGVQCEACHGAGSDYWPAEIMMDPEKARAAGLSAPNEALCRSCHGSGLSRHRSTFSMPKPEDRSRSVH